MQHDARFHHAVLLLSVGAALARATAGVASVSGRRNAVLLYVPTHVNQPASHVQEYCDCLFAHSPFQQGERSPFDVLLTVSGGDSDGRLTSLHTLLANCTAHLRPSPRVFVEFVKLATDDYAFGAKDEERSNDWVGGPNSAFYDAFLDGHIYQTYVQHYDFVQQLETDVCALRAGWLGDLLQPLLDDKLLLVSGSTVQGDCAYDPRYDSCEPLKIAWQDAAFMLDHVNGNAMYRICDDLRDALDASRTEFANSQPFDLSLYWTLVDMDMQDRLLHNPLYLNMVCLVDETRFLEVAYHGLDAAALIHAPRRLRTSSLKAAAARGKPRRPLTIVPVTQASVALVNNMMTSLRRAGVSRTMLVAADEVSFVAASRLAPYRVVAAFDAEGQHVPSIGGEHASSTTMTAAVLTLAARTLRMGYAPFVVGSAARVLAGYDDHLARLPPAVYVGRRHAAPVYGSGQNSDADVDMLYIPSARGMADAVDAWVAALQQGSITSHHQLRQMLARVGVNITWLLPHKFVHGGPGLGSNWPHKMTHKPLVMTVQERLPPVDAVFALKQAGAWHDKRDTLCTNHSVFSRDPVLLTRATQAATLDTLSEFMAFVGRHGIQCAVLPTFALEATGSTVPTTSMFSLSCLADAAGRTALMPRADDVSPGSKLVPWQSGALERAGTVLRDRGSSDLTSKNMESTTNAAAKQKAPTMSCLAHSLQTALDSALRALGSNYACIEDTSTSAEEVALVITSKLGRSSANPQATTTRVDTAISALLDRHNNLTSYTRLYLRGAWRVAKAEHVATSSDSLWTLTDVRHAVAVDIGIDPAPSSLPMLGHAVPPLFDPAYADIIEQAVCERAGASFDVDLAPTQLDAIVDTMATFIPSLILAEDLESLRVWRQRPKKVIYRRSALQTILGPGRPIVDSSDVVDSVMSLATSAPRVPVFMPPLALACEGAGMRLEPWRSVANITKAYARLPNLLPPSTLFLMHPRLAAELAQGSLIPVGDHTAESANVARTFKREMQLVKRLASKWAHHSFWSYDGDISNQELAALCTALTQGQHLVRIL